MKNNFFLLSFIMIFLFVINVNSQEITKQEKGYFNLTEIGLYTGNNSYEVQVTPNKFVGSTDKANSFSLRNINGIFITNKISMGVGVGLENYSHKESDINNNLLLLFLDARYYFKNQVNTFFAYGDAGSSVKISDNFSKGAMFNLGLGYKFKVAEKIAMIGSLGYNDQTIKGEPSVTKNRYYGFAARIGLLL